MPLNVGIYLYDEVEVLDFAGPFEVFSTASRVRSRLEPASPQLFNVFTIGRGEGPVQARGNLIVLPTFSFADHPPIDLLVVPGGIVTAELEKEEVIQWIRQTAGQASLTTSVCTGAFLLAQAGLLHGKTVTTHWEDLADLQARFPELLVQAEQRWIEQDNIITSAGISAGIDMSLHLVRRLADHQLALKTAHQMEYDWQSHSP